MVRLKLSTTAEAEEGDSHVECINFIVRATCSTRWIARRYQQGSKHNSRATSSKQE